MGHLAGRLGDLDLGPDPVGRRDEQLLRGADRRGGDAAAQQQCQEFDGVESLHEIEILGVVERVGPGVESLEVGAIDTLKRHGARDEDITIVRLPGAFEMPLVLDKIAGKGDYDAIITKVDLAPRTIGGCGGW